MLRQRLTRVAISSALAATLVAALSLAAAQTLSAEPTEAFPSARFSGNWYPSRGKHEINNYSYSSSLSLPPETQDDAGGAAAFGWFESGGVLLLAHAVYLPSVQSGFLNRKFEPASRIELGHLPRYVMLCSWPTENDQLLGPRYVGYAEREDANATDEYRSFSKYHSLHASWVRVPAKRVASKFSDRDYCGEIAQTKNSPVAVWLPEEKKANEKEDKKKQQRKR